MTSQIEPLITVVMSVYNSEEFLEEAIKSILGQTFRDFELIMVDDASTDDSLAIMEVFANKDHRLKLIRNQKNIGLTKSLIKAIEQTNGEYIARQDSDDISLPRRLEKQVEFLTRNPSYGAVGTYAEIIDKAGLIIKKALVPRSWLLIKQILKFGNCFLHGSMMFRRGDYIKAGGYRAFISLGQDFDLWLRISKIKKMTNLHEVLYRWRKTENSITASKEDSQVKIGALAMFDSRYGKRLELTEDFEVNAFIDRLLPEDRIRYYKCLRNLCLWHGNIKMAEKYCKDISILSDIFIAIAGIAIKLIRTGRH